MHPTTVFSPILLLCALAPACGSTVESPVPPSGCVEAVVGDACTPGTSTPCSQPANPCEEGYIWSCDNNNDLWIRELIACTTGPTATTTTTAACGAGEVLFVDDVAGDLCAGPVQGSGTGAAQCPAGTYLYEPTCCYSPTHAYCVPAPSECSDGLTCGCASSICDAQCGGVNPGVMCSNAVGTVIDCLCGKA
jgi:hypothetical protein